MALLPSERIAQLIKLMPHSVTRSNSKQVDDVACRSDDDDGAKSHAMRDTFGWQKRQITQLPCTISTPGEYVVARDLSFTPPVLGDAAITIASSNVTVDFRGLEIASAGATAGTGILVSGALTNITVRNGRLRGWGTAILMAGGPTGWCVEDMRITTGGFAGPIGTGISVTGGTGGVIRRIYGVSTSAALTEHGVELAGAGVCRVQDCSMIGWGSDGYGVTTVKDGIALYNCYANANNIGFDLDDDISCYGCVAATNTTSGFEGSDKIACFGCQSIDNGTFGYNITNTAFLFGCLGQGNTSANYQLTGTDNICMECVATDGGAEGFRTGSRNVMMNCAALNSTSDGFVAVAAVNAVFHNCASSNAGTNGFSNTSGAFAVTADILQGCNVTAPAAIGITDRACVGLQNCAVNDAGTDGISIGSGSVQRCIVNGTATGSTGFIVTAFGDTMFQHCIASNVGIAGFSLVSRCALQGCIAQHAQGHGFDGSGGFRVMHRCIAKDTNVGGAGGAGFLGGSAGSNNLYQECIAQNARTGGTSDIGFDLVAAGATSSLVLNRCVANNCAGDGFDAGTGVGTVLPTFVECEAHGNGGDGFALGTDQAQVMKGCVATHNTGTGILNTAGGTPAPRRYSCLSTKNTAAQFAGVWSGADAHAVDPVTVADVFTGWINISHT